MKKRLVIFGSGDIAQLAHFYFSTDSDYDVVCFTVDAAYITEPTFCGLPVIAFEDIVKHYGPEDHDLFVALSYSRLNEVRKGKYLAAKALGYRLTSFVSSRATVLNEGRIGENCFIFEDNTIQPFVTIGNNVTLWSGNHIGHHSTIKDHTFIASHVVVSGGSRSANSALSASTPRFATTSRSATSACSVQGRCCFPTRSRKVFMSARRRSDRQSRAPS